MPHSNNRKTQYNSIPLIANNNNINIKKNNYRIQDFTDLNTGACNSTPSVLAAVDRLIAIGDLHGDLTALLYALKKAGVIDYNGGWIGGKTIVVQVGDVLDRGGRGVSVPSDDELEEIEIFHYLYKLNNQARTCGGRVISLIGNHELMNILGDFRYASSEHVDGFGGYQERINAFKPGSTLAKKISCNSLAIVKIGDWIFVHGGLLPEHIEMVIKTKDNDNNNNNNNKTNTFFKKINNLVRGVLNGDIRIDSISQDEEKILFGGDGIFWTRRYSDYNVTPESCDQINKTLSLLDINHKNGGIVVGHTPQKNINSVCKNKIWRIDTAMSEAFGKREGANRIEILEINKNGETDKGGFVKVI